ncbi:MAG: ATP-binding protein [Chloroflexota bacterium]|nr:hypothetical protein [Anaerolineae bacterium]
MAEECGSSEARVSPEMGELIRNLGHDLRNKFCVVKNSVYYLRMKVDNDDSKVQRHLNIVEKEINTANGIIMDLMNYAWPKASICQDLPLNDVLKRALAQVHISDGVLQHLDLSSDIPALQGDRIQLEHAFTNIMAWVISDLSPGESLGIATRVQDGHIEVRIASAGLKLASQSLDDLFDFHGTPSAYRVALPLLISKSLIEGHGGTLDISRKDDAVTVVIVRFPV